MKVSAFVFTALAFATSTASLACGSYCVSGWIGGYCPQWKNYSCLSNENVKQVITINVQLKGRERMTGCSARWEGFNETENRFHLASSKSAEQNCRDMIEDTKGKHGGGDPKEVIVSYVNRMSTATAYARCVGQGNYSAVGDNFQQAFANLFQVMRDHPTTGNCIYWVDNEYKGSQPTYPTSTGPGPAPGPAPVPAIPPTPTYTTVTTAEIPAGYSLKWSEFVSSSNEWVEWVQFDTVWKLIGPNGAVRQTATQIDRNNQYAVIQDQSGGLSYFYANGTMIYRTQSGQTFSHQGTLYKKSLM